MSKLVDPLRPWLDVLLAESGGVALLDCHTHIGANDPDGFTSEAGELLEALTAAGARGVVFPMHEPDGYRAANETVRAVAADSDGRLAAFCRVDPHDDPVGEAIRSLDAGARGIKLHPRAERFVLSDPALEDVWALAAERSLPVLIHAGRGIPALGRDALALAERFPSLPLILAHAGVSDLSWLWRHAPDHPNLLFDTAWWSAVDVLALLALVPPGQVVFGSDAPYGTPTQGAILTMRCALQAGLSAGQVGSVMGGQAERLLAGEAPLDAGPAPGSGRMPRDLLLDRVHTVLAIAVRHYLHDQSAEQEIALARLACDVGGDAPEAAVCRAIESLLDTAADASLERTGADLQHPAVHLLVTAAVVARTPDVPVPGP